VLLSQVLASVMGAKYIATLPDASSGAGVFESGFQAIGEDLLTITQSSSFNWIVVVLDEQRAAFEASAVAAAQSEDPSGVTAAQVAAYGIRDYDASTRTFHRASQAPLYVVRWSTSPRGDSSLLANHLQNLYTDAFRKPVLDHVLSANATFMTPIVPGLVKDVTAKLSPPSCIVYAPTWTDPQWGVYNAQPAINNNTSSTIGRAICASGFHMDTVRDVSDAGEANASCSLYRWLAGTLCRCAALHRLGAAGAAQPRRAAVLVHVGRHRSGL